MRQGSGQVRVDLPVICQVPKTSLPSRVVTRAIAISRYGLILPYSGNAVLEIASLDPMNKDIKKDDIYQDMRKSALVALSHSTSARPRS